MLNYAELAKRALESAQYSEYFTMMYSYSGKLTIEELEIYEILNKTFIYRGSRERNFSDRLKVFADVVQFRLENRGVYQSSQSLEYSMQEISLARKGLENAFYAVYFSHIRGIAHEDRIFIEFQMKFLKGEHEYNFSDELSGYTKKLVNKLYDSENN